MTPDEIITSVCREFDISTEQLRSKNRTRPLPQIRHILCYHLNFHFPAMTLAQIGKLLNIHHTTVIHGIKAANNDRDRLITHVSERVKSAIDPPVKLKFNDANTETPRSHERHPRKPAGFCSPYQSGEQK